LSRLLLNLQDVTDFLTTVTSQLENDLSTNQGTF